MYLIFVFQSAPYIARMAFVKKNSGKHIHLVSKYFYALSRQSLSFMGAKIEVQGRENIPSEACVFVSNHQGIMDVFLLVYELQKSVGFIAKKEVVNIPVVRYWLVGGKGIYLNREDARQGMLTIMDGVKNLEEGYSMAVFPEGTRSRCPEMGEFKKGALKLATKAKVAVVPVSISGSYKLFDAPQRDKRVKVIIHAPMETENLTKQEERCLSDRVFQVIKAGLQQ